MAKKKKQGMGAGSLVLLALAVFAVSGAGAYLYFTRPWEKQPVKVEEKHKQPAVVSVEKDSREIKVYLPDTKSKELYLVPVTRTTDAKGDILDSAMNVLIATSNEPGEASGIVPEGTKLLSPIKVEKGTATVNFSKEFIANFNGGTDQEALTLNSIVQTLVNNSGGAVKRVQILVEGEKAESLGEHFDLTVPITADSTMLKPGS